MQGTEGRDSRVTRREFVKAAAIAPPALLLGMRVKGATSARPAGEQSRMNVVLFVTDQERSIQHFPAGWAKDNLPGLTRLQRNGLTFENAFCNACMCSPSRSTFLTGYFPAQHGVKYTLEQDMPADEFPQVELPLDLENIASVASAAGYNVVYKGKWHLSKPEGDTWAPSDAGRYGFARWDPPDAGENQDLSVAGGGIADNDGRFMNSVGSAEAGGEGVLQYLRSEAAAQQPFFLIVSLVNPHDVLFYPRTYLDGGYDDSWLEGEIGLPKTVSESLSTKPSAQAQFLKLFNLTGPLVTPQMKRNYLNFYANLMKVADGYLVNVLDTLEATGLLDDTLVIRTSDHGEMGVAHGGLRQKNFNAYEETLRVPLVYSNPRLYERARSSSALVSHVDFLPTLASFLGAPASTRADWEGVDYSRLLRRPSARGPQEYVVFTFDDFQAGQPHPPYVPPPNHIVSLREERYKIARYYDVEGRVPDQWEMYDLERDPFERHNIAYPPHRRTKHEKQQLRRLKGRLARVEATRLQPLPTTVSVA